MSKGPEYRVPPRTASLGYLGMAWIEAHCVVPDGDMAGEPFVPTLDHRVYLANWYRVAPTAKVGDRAAAFVFRIGLWVAAQKVGKSPGVAAETTLEFVGPVVYDGRAIDGEAYVCAEQGCPCGWVYFYERGEPKGRPWATPRIQLAAVVEDQVENTWGALVPMIDNGPLANLIPKTGEAFIRHPSGNRDSRIEIVTSKAASRLGARISAGKCDETGLWTESNGMVKFERTLRRGAAGMGGRVSHSSNPPDPAENSALQQHLESPLADILKHHFPPPEHLDFRKKRDRAAMFRWNYASSPWVDLRDIEAEAVALMEKDPAEAERFYGNRIRARSGSWMEMPRWEQRRIEPIYVAPRTKVALGFDGSDNDDMTGIRLETLDYYQFTPLYGEQRRPTLWDPRDHGGRIPRAEVMAAFDELSKRYTIVRAYLDPPFWETEIDTLAERYGASVFLRWPTYRVNAMHAALERTRTDVYNEDSGFRHDGDEQVALHFRNAIIRNRSTDLDTGVRRYILGKPAQHQKVDFVQSSVLAHEAAADANAAGLNVEARPTAIYY